MMEKKEDCKSLNEKEVECKREKITYKVVPVPYYYPVPVDAEWYYKNYERFSRENERFFQYEDPPLDHFPPPSFPFPRIKEHFPRDKYSFDRYRRSMSPSPTNSISPRHARSTSPESESAETKKEKPESIKVNNNNNNENNDGDKKTEQAEAEVKQESKESDDETTWNTDEEKPIEVNRRRKRYLMTFPYDQRKKYKENEESEGLKQTKDRKDREYDSQEMYPPNHQSMVSSHVPYVMVPMRSSSFISPDMVRGPRYLSERRPFEDRSYDCEPRYKATDEESRHRNNEKEDEKEARYHSNGRRARTVFTRQQLLTLNNVFDKHPFVSGERMSELSDQLGLDRKIVKIWFQNKRQYARKKGSLLEREEDYYYEYKDRYYASSNAPTMAER